MKSYFQCAMLALAIATLAACGGGSSGSSKDNGSNPEGPSNDNALVLQQLESGVYEMSMLLGYSSPQDNGSIILQHTRISVHNGNFVTDTYMLTEAGWTTEKDYYDGSTASFDLLTLTASGWQVFGSTPCRVEDTTAGVIMNCGWRQARLTLEPIASLATTSMTDAFAQIADERSAIEDNQYQAVVAGTAGLTSPVGTNARTYHFNIETQMPEVSTFSCTPTAPNQPASQWFCETEFTSTNWSELTVNEDTFPLWLAGEGIPIKVRLEGDPANAHNGNIQVAEAFTFLDEVVGVGSVIGSWEKLDVYTQSIIHLTLDILPASDRYNALAIANNRILFAVYNPIGRISIPVFNAEAAEALNDAAVGIFPIAVSQ
ncbi:MAG: hypothetical protein HPY82_25180 [Gammaproteobacteria bacterium]|nr:hypothetical protein [Gammaproteobacteria bacterium]